MRKKWLTALLVMSMAAALTGCGKEKVPTIEEIRDNLSDQSSTTYDGDVSLSVSGDVKFSDLSSDLVEVADMVKDIYDIDVTDKMTVDVSVKADVSGQHSGNIEYYTYDGTAKFDTNIDMLLDYIDEPEVDLARESYIDKRDEIRYYKDLDDGDWYYEDYESDDDDSDPKQILDFFISVNEYAGDDDNPINVVVTDDGRYYISFEGVIDQDFILGLSDDDIDLIEDMLDEADLDADIDGLREYYENYGEYMDISIPMSIDLYYINIGDKKNPEYVLDETSLTVGFEANVDLDKDEVEDLLYELGAPSGVDLSCQVKANISMEISLSAKLGYDDIDLDIPSKVQDNAIEYDPYDDEVGLGDIDIDDLTDPTASLNSGSGSSSSSANITTIDPATGRELHTLMDYDGLKIFNFAVPEGWEYDNISSDTCHFMDSDDGNLVVQCFVPNGICAYYESDPDAAMLDDKDNYKFIESYTTKGNPYGYDIYVDKYDSYYAVVYGEEFTSLVIEYDQSYGADTDPVDDLKAILDDAF